MRLLFAISLIFSIVVVSEEANYLLENVDKSFANITNTPEVLKFVNEKFSIPSGGHLQGIQLTQDKKYAIISGSSYGESYFFIVAMNNLAKIIAYKKISDQPYNHAGGIQIVGNYLVVGIEDDYHQDISKICIFNIANPKAPSNVLVEIKRKGPKKLSTAGAVAMVKRNNDYLLIVATWDSSTLDFYVSNGKSLDNKECQFRYLKTWSNSKANKTDWIDKNWGSHQALNLVKDKQNNLYIVCFNRNWYGEDWMDLYQVFVDKKVDKMLLKKAKKHMVCKQGASFRLGAGLYIGENTLEVYACEKYVNDKTVINRFVAKK